MGNSSWSTRMSPTSIDRITLTGSQHRELTRMTRAGRTEQRLVTRAQIVLAASAGESNAQIARWLGICEDTVRKWRRRWCTAPGAASLADAKRSGRRPKFTAVQPTTAERGRRWRIGRREERRRTAFVWVVQPICDSSPERTRM